MQIFAITINRSKIDNAKRLFVSENPYLKRVQCGRGRVSAFWLAYQACAGLTRSLTDKLRWHSRNEFIKEQTSELLIYWKWPSPGRSFYNRYMRAGEGAMTASYWVRARLGSSSPAVVGEVTAGRLIRRSQVCLQRGLKARRNCVPDSNAMSEL